MWTPDVYQGAPSPVTGFMAAGAKVAGFAALLRVFSTAFATYELDWRPLVWVLAVASLAVGSIVAIVQEDIKRMLAYSSINHAGYVLIGFHAATDDGLSSAMFYLLAYTFMILGSFAVVTLIGGRGDSRHALSHYRGLGSRQPILAGILTLFLLAQAGVPLTAGFIGKFTVFSAAIDEKQYSIVIIGLLATVVATFFYLRVIVLMYMTAPEPAGAAADTSYGTTLVAAPPETAARVAVDPATGVAIGICVVATIVMGVVPQPVLDFARDAGLLF
jgi:NADH-quinone oxidoreductase subunit N